MIAVKLTHAKPSCLDSVNKVLGRLQFVPRLVSQGLRTKDE